MISKNPNQMSRSAETDLGLYWSHLLSLKPKQIEGRTLQRILQRSIIEPVLDKTYNKTCATSEDRSDCASAESDQSLR